MYVFRVDHLTLDNQLVCSFLGSTISTAPSFHQLFIVICVEMEPPGLFPTHFVMSYLLLTRYGILALDPQTQLTY